MMRATEEFLQEMEDLATKRKEEIRKAEDHITVSGVSYYVSNEGNDANDGLTPETAWQTLAKISETELNRGDGVFFRRGDLFRGSLKTCSGVTYAAYGKGDKPKFYGWEKNLADPALWELHDAAHHIWKWKEPILDCGTLVFNDGEAHCRKLIPSYRNGQFVCRDDESRPFDMAKEMTRNLDLFCRNDAKLTQKPSKGEDFPIPAMDWDSLGELYLRCDRGNPAEVFHSIEALTRRHMIYVKSNSNVTIDNLCLKYIGTHAIGAGGFVCGLHISNCEIGWVGGAIQHYMGTDPNYPQGRRGSVTRYGNAIEIYGGCDDYIVSNCYIYQIYDAGITHQVTTNGKKFIMTDIHYVNNLIEHCVYSIEYFLEKTGGDTESYIDGCEMSGNFLRFSGYGWGQQRHNTYTPAHIKGWSYENTARNYTVHDNIFDRAAYRMLHLVAKKAESCPVMYNNTYIQKYGHTLGQYGANEVAEPFNISFDERVGERIANEFHDTNAKIYYLD
jgi:hypothetical protein